MNPTTKKTVLVVIAIIAVALFVHYMLSPSLSEAFQEGAGPASKTSSADTTNRNITATCGKINSAFKVQNPKTKKMRPVHEQIQDDIQDLVNNKKFDKILKNGNLQRDAPEYKSLIDKIKGYVPNNNPEPNNPTLKDFNNIKKNSLVAAEQCANNHIALRGLSKK